MSPRKPWQPRVESDPELNPFSNDAPGSDGLNKTPEIEDPEEDSAPLQGSRDLSDEDSLDDVIADDADRRTREDR
jgi:hypothetical protein